MLTHALVTAESAEPRSWLLFLHGILGSGANWRSFARKITDARPDLGCVLVDLRLHGGSLDVAPPHTVRAAARDLVELAQEIPGVMRGIVAHSFGGKVALTYVDATAGKDLGHVFVIDATPGARPEARGSESTRAIVEMLLSLPEEMETREEFLTYVSEHGVTREIAMWLAMNVRPIPGTTRYTFRIDVRAVKAMLDDYFLVDLWDVIEKPRSSATTIHLVVGGKSTVVDVADRVRAEAAPQTTLDVIADAGHWVHADAPAELLRVVLSRLG